MADIIDAVGGIDVELAEGELDVYGKENGRQVNWGINGMISEQCGYMGLDKSKYLIKKAGLQHLNGVQAVAYARIRHAANIEGTNDDFGRTDRQRYVMEQLFNKAVTLNKSQYVSLAKALIPCSETSLSYSQIIGLAFNILLSSPTFEQSRVPLTEYQMASKSISGAGSCLYYDLDYAAKIIKAFIYDDITPEDYMETNGIEKNDWYANRYSTSSKTSSSTSSSNITASSASSSSKTSSASSSSKINSSGSESKPTSSDDTVTSGQSSDNTTTSEPVVSSTPSDSSETESSEEPSSSTESPATSEPDEAGSSSETDTTPSQAE